MTQSTLNFDAGLGKLCKDIGQMIVLANEPAAWREAALERLHELCMERASFTSDNIRQKVLGSGLLHPSHANSWGSLVAVGARRGWMKNSGRYVASAIIGNHAMKIPTWISLLK